MIKNTLDKFSKKDFYEKSNLLAYLCLCLFLLDCSIMGGGRYFEFFGLSVRMVLGGLCIIFSIPTLLRDWKKHIKEPLNILFGIFVVWFIVCAIRGWNSNNNREVLITDVKGFMYLFLVPVSINCITGKERMKRILDIVLLGALIQALIVFFVNVACSIDIENLKTMYRPFMNILLGNVSTISNSIFRIFMSSGPYLIAGCVIAIYRQMKCEKINKAYVAVVVLCLNALLFSYTRSLYGSAGITAVMAIILAIFIYPEKRKLLAKYIVTSVLCTAVLVAGEEIVFRANYFNFALARTLGTEIRFSYTSTLLERFFDSPNEEGENKDEQESQEAYLGRTEESDELRELTEKEMLDLVKKSPIIGNGLGAASPSRNGPDEYFYLDMLARMGVIGMILYVLPYLYMIWIAVKKKSAAFLVCSVLPFWIATAFNPWMNAAIGISWYAISATSAAVMHSNVD